MALSVSTPTPDRLGPVLTTLASWQHEGLPVQLHPGDLGWHWRHGADAVAGALRVWRLDGPEGEPVAIAMVDVEAPEGATADTAVVRMALAPEVAHDDAVAADLVDSLEDPDAGVVSAANVAVEARFGPAFRSLLSARGWTPDDPWTPLHLDLTDPVEDCGLRIESLGADDVAAPETGLLADRAAVQVGAFDRSTFTVEKWRAMAEGPAYRDGRCLVGYDDDGAAVAAVTVWSAGPGRAGLLEPLGAHREHRGRGHGVAITRAAAAALRELGSSSATVATPSANRGGVATYLAAGFTSAGDVTDFRRPR